jgi:hypothetical protein
LFIRQHNKIREYDATDRFDPLFDPLSARVCDRRPAMAALVSICFGSLLPVPVAGLRAK